ncbi:MAG: urease accessory protein UreD [Siculibacillus sp.]|nr:urease accessory protein UreD [Siculibacillus sp.]
MTTRTAPSEISPSLRLERARGRAEVAFKTREGATVLDRLFQEGQAKIRLPKSHGRDPATAVLINTAGGIAGGDRLAYGARFGAGTRAVVTSQAAERVYRSSATDGSLAGEVTTWLAVEAGAFAEWLPQETILFDGAALDRRLEVEMAADARLLLCESVVLGRAAMGERVENCRLVDRFRIRRGGRLVFADTLRIEGAPGEILAGAATGRGATATATILWVAPEADAGLEALRALLDGLESEAGASAWDGMVCVRLVHGSARSLRDDLVRVLLHIRQADLPRVWSC